MAPYITHIIRIVESITIQWWECFIVFYSKSHNSPRQPVIMPLKQAVTIMFPE
jgi:hypothetical protein